MRKELLWNPRLLVERLALESQRRRRKALVRRTLAGELPLWALDTLELIDLAAGSHVVYDVGAHIGWWTRLAHARLPQAEIHAFEPLAVHEATFQAELGAEPRIHFHRVALGNTRAARDMWVMDGSYSSSFLEPLPAAADTYGVRSDHRESIEVRSLDSYTAEEGIPAPDLIKLDVQGFEIEVMKGADGVLRHARWLLTEVSFRPFYDGQPLCADVVAWLADAGYRVYAVSPGAELGVPLAQIDMLFRRD